MGVDRALEKVGNKWLRIGAEFQALEKEVAAQRKVIALLEAKLLKRLALGMKRCQAPLTKCSKQAIADGLCSQHWQMTWGHKWKFLKIGVSQCQLCGVQSSHAIAAEAKNFKKYEKCPIRTKETYEKAEGKADSTEAGTNSE